MAKTRLERRRRSALIGEREAEVVVVVVVEGFWMRI